MVKQNRYSIRKSSLGVASLAIGSIFMLSVSMAQAEELIASDSNVRQESSENDNKGVVLSNLEKTDSLNAEESKPLESAGEGHLKDPDESISTDSEIDKNLESFTSDEDTIDGVDIDKPIKETILYDETTPIGDKGETVGNHTVAQGDTLWALSQKYNVSINDLKTWNKLSSNTLYSNMVLRVSKPVNTTSSSQAKQVNQPSNQQGQENSQANVTVKKGEYLYLIARRHGLTIDELKSLNGLKTNVLYTGQVLRVGKQSPLTNTSKHTNVSGRNQVTKKQVDKTVTVKKGEYLYLIAQRHGLSVDQLKRLNNLSSNILRRGQVLKVSQRPSSIGIISGNVNSHNRPAPKQSTTTVNQLHQVRPGDTLFAISQKYGVSMKQIKDWNHLTSNVLYSSMKLIVGQGGNHLKGSNDNVSTNRPAKPLANGSALYPAMMAGMEDIPQLNVPFLSQHDPRWKNAHYGNDVSKSIWENGCAIVSLAMVDSYFKNQITDPSSIANWAGLKHYAYGLGTKWTIFDDFAKTYGYKVTYHGANVNSALNAVQAGEVGVTSLQPGYFIKGGHIAVIRGYDKGKVYMNDPYDYQGRVRQNTFMGHDVSHLKQDSRAMWTFRKL